MRLGIAFWGFGGRFSMLRTRTRESRFRTHDSDKCVGASVRVSEVFPLGLGGSCRAGGLAPTELIEFENRLKPELQAGCLRILGVRSTAFRRSGMR